MISLLRIQTDTLKFNTTATETDFLIPFKLSEESFTHWLSTLDSNSAAEKTHQVLLAIQAINQEDKLTKKQKSLLLECIYKSMLDFLTPLNTIILNSSLPLAKHEQQNTQNIVSIYAELANGFESCLPKISDLSSAQSMFYGLQSLINAYLHIAEIYQQVYPGFWKQSYKFYGLASKLKIQDLNIEQHGYHSNTINKAFKHLIALYHCDLEHFRPRDIFIVSACVEMHTSVMLLGRKIPIEKTSRYSSLDLTLDKPPSVITNLKQTEKNAIRFFSAYSAAIEINKNAPNEAPGSGVIKSINRENILQAAKTLSLSQQRKFTRFNEENEYPGIIGFSHLIEQLHNASPLRPSTTNKKAIDQRDPRIAGGWAVPNIELVTEGYESIDALKQNQLPSGLLREEQSKAELAIKSSLRKNIWTKSESKAKHIPTINPDKLYVVDSSIKGYRIIFDTNANQSTIQIGDIIGINNNNTMEIGMICRLTQLTEHKLQLGIKLLALESELCYISLPNHDSVYTWAIFLPGIKALNSPDSLIFNDSKFRSGEFINLHRANIEPVSCRLNKLLHLTSAAMHIELFNARAMQ